MWGKGVPCSCLPSPPVREGLEPIFSNQPGFAPDQDLVLPSSASSVAGRAAREKPGLGRAQGWKSPGQERHGTWDSGIPALCMLDNWPPAREETGKELGKHSKMWKLSPGT